MPWMASHPPSLCAQRVGHPHVLCTGLLSRSGSLSTPHLVLGDRSQLSAVLRPPSGYVPPTW